MGREQVLSIPNAELPFIVDTDACDRGLGAVLSQLDSENVERPVAFASRALSTLEKKYTTMEKECLAVIWAVTTQFHGYLYGARFLLRTDNQPLSWLRTLKNPTPRLARWILKLQEYDFEIEHRPGSRHRNADALSRLPVGEPASSVNTILHNGDWNRDDIRERQLADVNVGPIFRLVQANTRPPEQTVPASKEYRRMFRDRNDFTERDPLLVRRSEHGEQTVIPAVDRAAVLQALHADPNSGHLGREKMIEKLMPGYYWYGMLSDADDYCRSCLECQQRKTSGP